MGPGETTLFFLEETVLILGTPSLLLDSCSSPWPLFSEIWSLEAEEIYLEARLEMGGGPLSMSRFELFCDADCRWLSSGITSIFPVFGSLDILLLSFYSAFYSAIFFSIIGSWFSL